MITEGNDFVFWRMFVLGLNFRIMGDVYFFRGLFCLGVILVFVIKIFIMLFLDFKVI